MVRYFTILFIMQTVYASGFIKNNKQYEYVNDRDNVVECDVQQLCDISLIQNDVFQSWIMTDGKVWSDSAQTKTSYTDGDGVQHIIIQATATKLDNPVILVGTNYQYKFNLKATTKKHATNSYVFIAKTDKDFNKTNAVIDSGLTFDFKDKKLDYIYYTKGDIDSNFMPKAIFNDGKKTYIRMSDDVEDSDLPTLFSFNNSNALEQLNNARYRKPYFVIDGMVKRIAIISGSVDNDNQIRIDIYKGKEPRIKHWIFTSYDRN